MVGTTLFAAVDQIISSGSVSRYSKYFFGEDWILPRLFRDAAARKGGLADLKARLDKLANVPFDDLFIYARDEQITTRGTDQTKGTIRVVQAACGWRAGDVQRAAEHLRAASELFNSAWSCANDAIAPVAIDSDSLQDQFAAFAGKGFFSNHWILDGMGLFRTAAAIYRQKTSGCGSSRPDARVDRSGWRGESVPVDCRTGQA